MASPETSSEEMDLRRRARRRLVGAIALALVVVVVLPMLFSPEPKPLGPEVDIRIPDQATPFRPEAAHDAAAEPVADEPAPPDARPEAPPVTQSPVKSAAPAPMVPAQSDVKPPAPRAPTAPERADRQVASEPKAPPKEIAATAQTFAARGYYLQLGAFGNEANAQQLAEQARAAGFNVIVQPAGGQVRVRMGPYAERQQALEVQARLREKGFAPILLGP